MFFGLYMAMVSVGSQHSALFWEQTPSITFAVLLKFYSYLAILAFLLLKLFVLLMIFLITPLHLQAL